MRDHWGPSDLERLWDGEHPRPDHGYTRDDLEAEEAVLRWLGYAYGTVCLIGLWQLGKWAWRFGGFALGLVR